MTAADPQAGLARVEELLAQAKSSLPAPVAGAIWEDGWESCMAAHGFPSPPKPRHLRVVRDLPGAEAEI